jgi:hypothetical protein
VCERGLDYAIGLAQAFRARLVLINVIQLHHDLPRSSSTRIPNQSLGREVAEAHMADLVRATDFGGVKLETEIKMGSPRPRKSAATPRQPRRSDVTSLMAGPDYPMSSSGASLST